jgi:hypothetical protein
MNTIADLVIENMIVPLNALKVNFTQDPKTLKSTAARDKATRIIVPDGREFEVSTKFWTSFCSLHDLNRNFFHYYTHQEVFERITTVKGNNVRISIEQWNGRPGGKLVACTGPGKPILKPNEVGNLIEAYSGTQVTYKDGVIQASFECPFPQKFLVANDEFATRFLMQMPVDGYGLPSAYLELMRTKSQSQIVGMSKAFKTQFQLGKEDSSLNVVLERAMSTFNNEEGYHSFKKRMESATMSWASFHEAGSLRVILRKAMLEEGIQLEAQLPYFQQFDAMTGNPMSYYGITSDHELSIRKAKTIPVKCTVYDLINFATEFGTHYLKGQETKKHISGWIGEKLTTEMDLEGTVETNPEFKDFFLAGTKALIVPGGDRQLDLDLPGDEDIIPDVSTEQAQSDDILGLGEPETSEQITEEATQEATAEAPEAPDDGAATEQAGDAPAGPSIDL